MTMIKTAMAAAALAFALSTGVIAQTATTTTPAKPAVTAPAPTTKAPKAAKVTKPKSEASMACSKDADAKNLHGKPRRTFREACMKGKK